jgi:hypothetical protein
MNNVYEEASHNKKLKFKNKSIEENYEIKVMKKEMKSSYEVSLIIIKFGIFMFDINITRNLIRENLNRRKFLVK